MNSDFSLARTQRQYARLAQRLSATGWISEGYVQDRGPGAGGPCEWRIPPAGG
jgi:hypothetical protein